LNENEDLKDCFNRFDNKFGANAECGIVFGVYSPVVPIIPGYNGTLGNVIEKTSSRYTFVVYVDMMQLMSKVPIGGSVEEGQF